MNTNAHMHMWKEVISFILLEEVHGIKFRNCRSIWWLKKKVVDSLLFSVSSFPGLKQSFPFQ